MKTRLTVVVDNISAGDLPGEWGLSILVEHNGKTILADAGASPLFANNLKKLGFDADQIDYATLSHAHYDHGNGMPTFFTINDHAKFYLRETAAEDCYAKAFIFMRYIGLPRRVLTNFAERIQLVSGDYELYPGAWLVPHKTPGLATIGKKARMYRKTAKGMVPDDFSHEQSLVLDTEKGLVVINCCSHGGAVNIIDEVQSTFPDKHVHGLIGGLHLFRTSDEEVRATAQAIRDTGIEFVCTGHCTGDRAYAVMKEELGESLSQLHTGLQIEF